MSAERADVQSQLDVIMEGTDHVPNGLSTLNQFLLYRQQLLNNPGPGPWIVADWKALRTNAGRATLVRKYPRPFTSLSNDERNRCARCLLSLFEEAVPPNSIGEAEFYRFVDCLLQSRIRYDKHLRGGAQLLCDVEENVVGMKFQAVNFPGPPPASQNWNLWAHATTIEGATGILATGKVLPTDYQVAGLDANEDTFSFYGRSMNNPEWTPGVAQLAWKCFHSTKNCSGIVFAGLMPSNHIKGKSASTSYENNLTRFYPLVHSCSNDRRRAIRFVAARIDFIFVLSDRS